MEKLTIKELAPYLSCGLKAEMLDYKIDYVGKQFDEIVGFHQWDKNCKYLSALTIGGSKPNIERIKPILRPLSDYDPSENGFCGFYAYSDFKWSVINKTLEYKYFEMLLENHFDVFGLIEKGLAIDINTL